ncbi:MAG: bacteriophage abortive infection AbiH family protein [Roseburia sp.]|nr:bacteriophage abortive infection AbiH family protein [Roseburia sp.]
MPHIPQLIILGNGFDLHCELKSSYKDFLHNVILDNIGENFGIRQMKSGVSGFWEKLLFEYYKKYGDVDYKWCDIEIIIKKTLWQIYYGDNSSTNINHGIWKKAFECSRIGRDSDVDASQFNDPISKYLFYKCVALFDYISNKGITGTAQEKLHLLIEHLLQELHNLEKRFSKYLKDNIVNPDNDKEINRTYLINAVNLLAQITGFTNNHFDEISDLMYKDTVQVCEQTGPKSKYYSYKEKNFLTKEFSKLKNIHILSFNYTDLFDILQVDRPCKYNNVHGKLYGNSCAESCNDCNIIFGIDDSLIQSQNDESELYLFSKTYRKMLNATVPQNILPINNDIPLEIKFYGHSLSQADYSYFQSIFDYYNLYGNSNVSLTFFYSKGFMQNTEIYKLINTYGRTLNNQEQGKNLIHKLLLEDRLKIVEID